MKRTKPKKSGAIKIPGGGYFSPASAAARLNLTEARIRQLIRWEGLECIRISERAWIIPEHAVLAEAEKRK